VSARPGPGTIGRAEGAGSVGHDHEVGVQTAQVGQVGQVVSGVRCRPGRAQIVSSRSEQDVRDEGVGTGWCVGHAGRGRTRGVVGWAASARTRRCGPNAAVRGPCRSPGVGRGRSVRSEHLRRCGGTCTGIPAAGDARTSGRRFSSIFMRTRSGARSRTAARSGALGPPTRGTSAPAEGNTTRSPRPTPREGSAPRSGQGRHERDDSDHDAARGPVAIMLGRRRGLGPSRIRGLSPGRRRPRRPVRCLGPDRGLRSRGLCPLRWLWTSFRPRRGGGTGLGCDRCGVLLLWVLFCPGQALSVPSLRYTSF
jgi:hypothetical protein